ncbi:hypothetical protein H696_05817 [Fonticula alba]|uniref:Splicing factor YJU2 n=1 Tax=Fonticula alba TaxID=691883 RepID=A0A058Z0A9_FONAL|nr:hypothetical protein H696_05817 [Fonticula alba]KCV67709.1 hypothetical protein H696_05817 [Fonticula alba]|eukprot:XP_009497893.1 hypothetical protein H696_05817 [Fonticula alba]
MAERKSTNKYYPADFDPAGGSLNTQRGHRVQPRDSRTGEAIVRFELPFAVRCLQCDHRMDRGVRFNARKFLTGRRYHSTAELAFRLRCALTGCPGEFIVRIDAAKRDYVVDEGARRVDLASLLEHHDGRPADGSAPIVDTAEVLREAREARSLLQAVEHDAQARRSVEEANAELTAILAHPSQRTDPLDDARDLRASFRQDRHARRATLLADRRSLRAAGLPVALASSRPLSQGPGGPGAPAGRTARQQDAQLAGLLEEVMGPGHAHLAGVRDALTGASAPSPRASGISPPRADAEVADASVPMRDRALARLAPPRRPATAAISGSLARQLTAVRQARVAKAPRK